MKTRKSEIMIPYHAPVCFAEMGHLIRENSVNSQGEYPIACPKPKVIGKRPDGLVDIDFQKEEDYRNDKKVSLHN
jgi:hypothetical protein